MTVDPAGREQARNGEVVADGRGPNRRAKLAAIGGRPGDLEAPHKRAETGPRPLEKAAVVAYRWASRVLARMPGPVRGAIGSFVAQLAYWAWPKKRGWVRRNFAHVLGEQPDSPAVRRLAREAYSHYGRYLVELMRLPEMPADEASAQVEPDGVETVERIRRESTGLIIVAAHIGNNEAIAAGLAGHGFPVSVVADDTSFPEMFELLREQRAAWGIRLIPWRNLREAYRVLKHGEMLALLVDWGYRADGIPVRLFGAWTTLPAGPAVLAAKTGATILPITSHRRTDGRFYVTHDDPIKVASADPAELARATQAIADALERNVRNAPEQWYSFKPIWPESPAERDRLAEQAAGIRGRLGAEGSGAGPG